MLDGPTNKAQETSIQATNFRSIVLKMHEL